MIIPDKNLFIVTSCLIPKIGKFNVDERVNQTIETLKSIRNVPNSIILFADCSIEKVSEETLSKFNGLYDICVDYSNNPDINRTSLSGAKSHAETLLLLNTLSMFKKNAQLMKLLHQVRRIFKLSGRYKLNENFTIHDHDEFGKYVFNKRIQSWMEKEVQRKHNSTDLLTTRLFSFCPSLIDDYAKTLIDNFEYLNLGLDTEHAHFINIKKEYLTELDVIGCEGFIASTGEYIKE